MKREVKINPNVDSLEKIIEDIPFEVDTIEQFKEKTMKDLTETKAVETKTVTVEPVKEKTMTVETKPVTVENDYSEYADKTVTSKDITVVKLIKEFEKAWEVKIPIPELGIDRKEIRNVKLPKSQCKMIETGKKYNAINVPLWLVKRMADDIRNGLL